MAGAIISRAGRRGHLVLLAAAVCTLLGAAPSWAQESWGGADLPYCAVYPPGGAPAIGPSNCVPVPQTLWEFPDPVPDFAAKSPSTAGTASPSTSPAPPAPQAPIVLRTPGAVTLGQMASLLAPVSKRAVSFNLSAADEYKKTDVTHRVSLTWSGPLQALADRLGAVYGLDVAIDDSAIRFSSRPPERAAGSQTSRTPEGRS